MRFNERAIETLDDSWALNANKNIEIEQLRQRVAELERENERFKAQQEGLYAINRINNETANRELAASQLENKRLREALECVMDDIRSESYLFDGGNGVSVVTENQAIEALREPTDTEALENYVKGRLGEPVAWRGMTGHGAVISVNPPAIQPDNWTPLYALKEPK